MRVIFIPLGRLNEAKLGIEFMWPDEIGGIL